MVEMPAGTVTFLFTDIEGSTRLWDEHPQAMHAALARHDAPSSGQPEEAARLLAASYAVIEGVGISLDPNDRVEYDRRVAAAREAPGESAFASIWREGQAISPEQAVAEANAEG